MQRLCVAVAVTDKIAGDARQWPVHKHVPVHMAAHESGILFPSQAHKGGTNLVVYSDRFTDDNSVTVNDPDGQLPRDQSSWAR